MGEVLSPEQERAAIVAYTGLWQLVELDPGAESASMRAARLELRAKLDTNDAADDVARRPTRLGEPRVSRSATRR